MREFHINEYYKLVTRDKNIHYIKCIGYRDIIKEKEKSFSFQNSDYFLFKNNFYIFDFNYLIHNKNGIGTMIYISEDTKQTSICYHGYDRKINSNGIHGLFYYFSGDDINNIEHISKYTPKEYIDDSNKYKLFSLGNKLMDVLL